MALVSRARGAGPGTTARYSQCRRISSRATVCRSCSWSASHTGRRVQPGCPPAAGCSTRSVPRWTGCRNRLALLVAAAEDTGELGVVLDAAERIGLGLNDFEPAERARLVRVVDGAVSFRHPLIRSAVYGRAPAADRITAHRALADVLPAYADRRAWHLASAAGGFDDDVADAMEAAALRADRRGGYAASAAAHERAARLTADPVVRGQRLAAAAMGARDSAQLDRAAALAQEASAMTEDPRTLAKLAWVRARLEFERGTPRHASEMVLAGAETVYDCDTEEAARMLDRGGPDGVLRRRGTGPGARRRTDRRGAAAGRSSAAPDAWKPARYLRGCKPVEPEDQIPPLPPAVRAIRPERLGMTIGNLAIHSAFLLMIIGDADEAWAQTERMLVEARERGLIGGLPHILLQHSQAALVAGRLREALRTANEGVQIAEDTGQLHSAANLRGVVARITAMTGDEDTCVALATEAIHRGAERHSSSVGLAVLALAVLDLGFGRYSAALERLASLPRQLRRHPTFAYLSPPEWAEAAARSGEPERAAETMAAYVPWARTATTPSCRPTCIAAAPCSDPTTKQKRTTKRRFGCMTTSTGRWHRARSELLYGEWLRRVRRRSESREPLRGALRVFERIGARSWAERTRAELRATGESVAAAAEAGRSAADPAGTASGAAGRDGPVQPRHRGAAVHQPADRRLPPVQGVPEARSRRQA